ncbi:MAG: hypothetical protein F6K28_49440 [Microcoleus sp. SIO2G3]|nr:hypothetical protein [Microcoleus sp. SIO2G3]
MGNGELGMGNGDGEWGMGNGEWGMGMGNGEWGMGNGGWGMGKKIPLPFDFKKAQGAFARNTMSRIDQHGNKNPLPNTYNLTPKTYFLLH